MNTSPHTQHHLKRILFMWHIRNKKTRRTKIVSFFFSVKRQTFFFSFYFHKRFLMFCWFLVSRFSTYSYNNIHKWRLWGEKCFYKQTREMKKAEIVIFSFSARLFGFFWLMSRYKLIFILFLFCHQKKICFDTFRVLCQFKKPPPNVNIEHKNRTETSTENNPRKRQTK